MMWQGHGLRAWFKGVVFRVWLFLQGVTGSRFTVPLVSRHSSDSEEEEEEEGEGAPCDLGGVAWKEAVELRGGAVTREVEDNCLEEEEDEEGSSEGKHRFCIRANASV